MSVGYARAPFDEIASLMERELDLESVEAGLDATLARGLSIYGGGGGVWFSDGNHRTSAWCRSHAVAAEAVLRRRVRADAGLRAEGARDISRPTGSGCWKAWRGTIWTPAHWDGRFSGGLGAQQIGRGGVAQSEWHLDARIGRRWGVGNRLDVFGAVTNSAVSSTSGAFRYRTAGVSVRLGL